METPIHLIHDSGYYDPWVNTYCGYGDSYDKGFEKGTTIKEEVTCKRCLKFKHYSGEKLQDQQLEHGTRNDKQIN